AMDQRARAVVFAALFVTGADEPFRELPGRDSGHRRARFVAARRRGVKPNRGQSQRLLDFLDQPLLEDLGSASLPVFQPADHHRMPRQIDHRARPEGGDDLALADFALGAGLPGLHVSSPSTAPPSMRCTHKLTTGSTLRIERWALNLRALGG